MRFPGRMLAVALLALLAVATWRVAAGRGGEPHLEDEKTRHEEPGGLLYTLSVEPASARVGESRELRLGILNQNPTAVGFEFLGGLEYDFTIARAGVVVWQWSRGQELTAQEHSRVLPAGASFDYAVTWDGRDDRGNLLEPGRYEVRAVFLGEPEGVHFIGPLAVELF